MNVYDLTEDLPTEAEDVALAIKVLEAAGERNYQSTNWWWPVLVGKYWRLRRQPKRSPLYKAVVGARRLERAGFRIIEAFEKPSLKKAPSSQQRTA